MKSPSPFTEPFSSGSRWGCIAAGSWTEPCCLWYQALSGLLTRLWHRARHFSPLWFLLSEEKDQTACLVPASCWFFAWCTLQPWRWRWHVPLKCWLTFNRLHGIISQKTELFIITTVRTSNPTIYVLIYILMEWDLTVFGVDLQSQISSKSIIQSGRWNT
jgi:hypothetical protein